MNNKNKTYDFLFFCGDIHGDIEIIPNFLKKNKLTNCAIFQVGDFGIGFESEKKENRRMLYLNKRLSMYNSDLFAIRGNHDNPKYFDGKYNMSNLFLLEDYSIININGINILGVGGAISVDRTERKGYWKPEKTFDYWKNENVVCDENKLKEIKDVDIVITHSAPSFCYPLIKSNINRWIEKDEKLLEDITSERNIITDIYNILSENNTIKKWYYGHYHKNYTTEYNDTLFYCLGIDYIEEYILKYEI